MKKVIIIIGGAVLAMYVIWNQTVASALLGLLLTGHIPGTSFTIPSWAMIACYCLIITILVTSYIEDAITYRRDTKRALLAARKARMPRRRYSHI